MKEVIELLEAGGMANADALRAVQALQTESLLELQVASPAWLSFLRRTVIGYRIIDLASKGLISVSYKDGQFYYTLTDAGMAAGVNLEG